jgi:hypothetical protein
MALVQDNTLGSRQNDTIIGELEEQKRTFHWTLNKLPVSFFRFFPAASSEPLCSPTTV